MFRYAFSLGCLLLMTAEPRNRPTSPLATEVQASDDDGATWSDVESSGSNTGDVWLFADADDNTLFYWVVTPGQTPSIYRVNEDTVPTNDQTTFYSRFGSSATITMSWNGSGQYAGVQ